MFRLLKLDLEKAFDKFEWNLIKLMLEAIAVPDSLQKLILSCITNLSFAVLTNGTPSKDLHTTREIRQGDLLSPYLFILCLEYLSIQIEKSISQKEWIPF